MSKADVLERADAAWRVWRQFLAAEAGAGRQHLAGQDGWSLAEAVAHVARWQDWAARHIPEPASTRRLKIPEIDPQNAEWAEADRGLQFDNSLERMGQAWESLRTAVAAVPEADWSRSLARLVEANTSEHYDEHQGWHPAG